MTQKYDRLYKLFFFLSLACVAGPATYYFGEAALSGALVQEKVSLCLLVMAVLIMTLVSWVNKVVMRSKIWIIVIGLYFCLDSFIEPILVIAITQIIDETILTPLKNNFREKRNIHREIDKRI